MRMTDAVDEAGEDAANDVADPSPAEAGMADTYMIAAAGRQPGRREGDSTRPSACGKVSKGPRPAFPQLGHYVDTIPDYSSLVEQTNGLLSRLSSHH